MHCRLLHTDGGSLPPMVDSLPYCHVNALASQCLPYNLFPGWLQRISKHMYISLAQLLQYCCTAVPKRV